MARIFKERTKVEEARRTFLDVIKPIQDTEKVGLTDCPGRVLAHHITAPRDVPHYRRAAMDGYAVRSQDTIGSSPSNPVMLQLAEEVSQGTCIRVHTGSNVPDGADAVVMVEDTVSIADMVEVRTQVHPNKHVGAIGEDMHKGDPVFKQGHLLRPCDAAVIASLGIKEVEVYKKPRVAVIPTGDELVPRMSTEVPPPGMVLETNGLMAGLYVDKWGGRPIYLDIVRDSPELIREALASSLDADMIILCGGTSVGERDHGPAVVDSLGKILVHGVGLSPGKPTALGVIDDVPVVCMPGYPVAGLVALETFAKPALRKVANIPETPEIRVRATLSAKITSKIGYMTYARVVVDKDTVCPVMTAGSGVLSSVARSNGYVIVPENLEGYEEGQEVDVILIE